MDIFSILPFDFLCLHFEFSSIYRLNRFMRVGSSRVVLLVTFNVELNAYKHAPDLCVCVFQVESFFEFSDRLENVMPKAYIWRCLFSEKQMLHITHL